MQSGVSDQNEIKLRVGNEMFLCSKTDLCERSKYFSAMFSHEFVENQQEEISLKDVDSDAFRTILERKSLESSMDLEEVLSVLRVSSMLQFDHQTEVYDKFVLYNFLHIKPIRVMTTSFELDLINLYRKSSGYCLWNFSKLKSTQDFLDLSFSELIKFVDNDSLRAVDGEMEIFMAISVWIEHNKPNNDNIVALLKTLRIETLSLTDIHTILKFDFVSKIDSLDKLFNFCKGAIAFCQGNKRENQSCICSSSKEYVSPITDLLKKTSRVLPLAPCNVISKTDEFPNMYFYNNDKIIKYLSLTHKPYSKTLVGFRIIAVGFKIYVIGGEQGYGYGLFNTGVWSYDIIKERWEYECEMLQRRRHFFITSLEDCIYVIGGTGKHRKVLDNIEKYDINSKQWSDCTGLNQKPVEAVCSYDNRIYIASRSIIIYNPYDNIFDTIPIDLPSCGVSSIHVHNDFLYSIIGQNAMILRWKLNDPTSNYRKENVGKFQQAGESVLINDDIYHFSRSEKDSTFCLQKLSLPSLKVVMVATSTDIGDFETKYIGCFSIPHYF